MRKFISALSLTVAMALGSAAAQAADAKPTIVLVHGAFAESSSWNGVITNLSGEDFTPSRRPIRCVARRVTP